MDEKKICDDEFQYTEHKNMGQYIRELKKITKMSF